MYHIVLDPVSDPARRLKLKGGVLPEVTGLMAV